MMLRRLFRFFADDWPGVVGLLAIILIYACEARWPTGGSWW